MKCSKCDSPADLYNPDDEDSRYCFACFNEDTIPFDKAKLKRGPRWGAIDLVEGQNTESDCCIYRIARHDGYHLYGPYLDDAKAPLGKFDTFKKAVAASKIHDMMTHDLSETFRFIIAAMGGSPYC